MQRSIENLLATGFGQFTIVTGYLSDRVVSAVLRWFPTLNVTFVDNPDFDSTNNAYSLNVAAAQVRGRAFALLDGDIIYDLDVLQQLIVSGPDSIALRTQGSIGLEEVKVQVDSEGYVRAISKEVPVPHAAGESIGIEFFSEDTSATLFDVLHERVVLSGLVNEYYEASFQQMIDEGVALRVVDIGSSQAIEIDTRDDLAAANHLLYAREALLLAEQPAAAAG